MTVIDKLELGISQRATIRAPIVDSMREINWERGSSRLGRSRHYAGVMDLRPYGADALLHAYCKHRNPADHKLELLDTGKKTVGELVSQIQAVFDVGAAELRVMRVDFCADVTGISVSWFQPRTYIKFKRFAHEIGETKYGQMGSRKIETLLMGKRPNVFRIYDKTAECLADFRKRSRKVSPDADPLDFVKEYGFPSDLVLTRVERQIGGGKVPRQLSTFGELTRNAPEFNPFTPLRIIGGRDCQIPTLEKSDFGEWLIGTRLRQLSKEWGMQQLRSVINGKSKGNSARWLTRYEKFLVEDSEQELTTESIYEIYRRSVTAQLSA